MHCVCACLRMHNTFAISATFSTVHCISGDVRVLSSAGTWQGQHVSFYKENSVCQGQDRPPADRRFVHPQIYGSLNLFALVPFSCKRSKRSPHVVSQPMHDRSYTGFRAHFCISTAARVSLKLIRFVVDPLGDALASMIIGGVAASSGTDISSGGTSRDDMCSAPGVWRARLVPRDLTRPVGVCHLCHVCHVARVVCPTIHRPLWCCCPAAA